MSRRINTDISEEARLMRERYTRRERLPLLDLYDPLSPSVYMAHQERQRALARLLRTAGLIPVRDKTLLEIGCGSGANLLDMIRLGFLPENLVGSELLDSRCKSARHLLPCATRIISGDATALEFSENSFDIVFQSTVFTSIIDDVFQKKLAERMWFLAKPGGGVLWYDFIYNNPRNSDVRGVPLRRIRQLFPAAEIMIWKITLAPPISRLVTKLHPNFYSLCNLVPLLRTHVLCWIKKRGSC